MFQAKSLLVFVALAGCQSQLARPTVINKKNEVNLMTFNVENLFDAKHDRGKDDTTYLPAGEKQNSEIQGICNRIEVKKWRNDCLKLDWSEDVVQAKLENLAAVIMHSFNGNGPDVLMLQEVENDLVLARLQKLLGDDYQTRVLIEGADARGIDTAVISKLPLFDNPKLIPLEPDSRGLLYVPLKLPDDQKLDVVVFHLPASYHPSEQRIQAFAKLKQFTSKLGPLMVAAGDANVSAAEDQRLNFFSTIVEKDWHLVHKTACPKCGGSYFYRADRSWSLFDLILLAPDMAPSGQASWTYAPESYQIYTQGPSQRNAYGSPRAFENKVRQGVSDHFPVIVKLLKRNPQP